MELARIAFHSVARVLSSMPYRLDSTIMDVALNNMRLGTTLAEKHGGFTQDDTFFATNAIQSMWYFRQIDVPQAQKDVANDLMERCILLRKKQLDKELLALADSPGPRWPDALFKLETRCWYVYELDNLKEVKYPRISSANVMNIYGNKNSSFGRRNRVALSYNSSIVDEYFYNQQGRVAKVRRTMIVPNGKILTYVTEFKYDTWGRLLEMIYPDGEILTYSFNDAGLANGVKGSKTYDYKYIDDVDYDYLGRLKEIKFDNGMSKTVQYYHNEPVYNITGNDQTVVDGSKLECYLGNHSERTDENSGMATVSNDGYLSSYFYDMSGNLAMNIGTSNEKVFVNGKESGFQSTIENKHLIVNPYFEDQDSLCVKHILLNGERVMTKVVDSFSYGARPVRIERAGSNLEELGFVVDYDALHTLTSNKAIQERVATVGDEFAVEHKPFVYPLLRNANVDDGKDNEETDIYVYGVDSENRLVGLYDSKKNLVLQIQNTENGEEIYKSDNLKFIPLIRSNVYMIDVDNNSNIPMFELNNELHQVRDAFGR